MGGLGFLSPRRVGTAAYWRRIHPVVLAIPLAVHLRGNRLGRREWAGTVAVAAGLAAFLVAASPDEGTPETTWTNWVLILVAVGGLMTLAVVGGQLLDGPARATLYAVGAGAAFGLLAALTK